MFNADEDDCEMALLCAGTVLYHGTSLGCFDPYQEDLEGPAWLSTSAHVAEHFAKNRARAQGGESIIAAYTLNCDLSLPVIYNTQEFQALCDLHNIDPGADLCQEVATSSLAGWHIPHNYPEGSDTLLSSTSCLDFIACEHDAPSVIAAVQKLRHQEGVRGKPLNT